MTRYLRTRIWLIAIATFAILVGACLVVAALQWRNPAFVARGPVSQIILVGGDLIAFSALITLARRHAWLAGFAVVLPVVSLAIIVSAAKHASDLRADVLAIPQPALRTAAAHVVAGFYDMDEARTLARIGVAGLFLSARNVRGRSAEAISAEVASLQALREAVGLQPLWIASDQEGGIVATLSPPLARPPSLASVVGDEQALTAEARSVAGGLRRLGVNVNFAPVVDVTRGRVDGNDRHSKIALRSLSPDPEIVAREADRYCRELANSGVQCTIKHFPGLGDVTVDTHVSAAHRATIEALDLEPFRRLTAAGGPRPWVMLSHLVVDELDPKRPASASPALIAVLRQTLGYDGILVTDDAAMAPYQAHLANHAVSSIEGGADLILCSWDPDVAFAVIEVLASNEDGDLAQAMHRSEQRLMHSREPTEKSSLMGSKQAP